MTKGNEELGFFKRESARARTRRSSLGSRDELYPEIDDVWLKKNAKNLVVSGSKVAYWAIFIVAFWVFMFSLHFIT